MYMSAHPGALIDHAHGRDAVELLAESIDCPLRGTETAHARLDRTACTSDDSHLVARFSAACEGSQCSNYCQSMLGILQAEE